MTTPLASPRYDAPGAPPVQNQPAASVLTLRRETYVLSSAETAECTCPEYCERDHGNE